LPSTSTEKTRLNLAHWKLGESIDLYNYTEMRAQERRQEELADMSAEQRARIEKEERKMARQRAREAKRLEELSQRQSGTQDTIPTSQRDLAASVGSQSRLRLALQRRREAAASQSQRDVEEIQSSVPIASGLSTIAESSPEFEMSGAISQNQELGQDVEMIEAETSEMDPFQAQDTQMTDTQPETQFETIQPILSQEVASQIPSFSQVSVGTLPTQGESSSQTTKPPKKKKRVKGF